MPTDTVTTDQIRPRITHNGGNHWTIMYDGAECKFHLRNDGRGFLYHLYVPPGCRNDGIGSAMLESVLETLEMEGADELVFEVGAANGATKHMFCSYGFTVGTITKSDPERQVVVGKRPV